MGRWADSKGHDRGKPTPTFITYRPAFLRLGLINRWKLLLDSPELCTFSQWEHKDAPTYFKGPVCVMGDAAHAMTPWQGSGAGQAIEDAMILETVLAAAKTRRDLEVAFRAYNKVQRPRTQYIVESSSVTGYMMSGRGFDVGLDPDKLCEALGPR